MIEELQRQLQREGHIECSVRVRTHASTSRITGMLSDGSVKVDLAAAPEDGKANVALVRLFAEIFRVSADHVQILSGASARRKLVRITA